jgi:hypothetical protein
VDANSPGPSSKPELMGAQFTERAAIDTMKKASVTVMVLGTRTNLLRLDRGRQSQNIRMNDIDTRNTVKNTARTSTGD